MFIYDDDLKIYQEADLANIENDLNVVLPATYKKFMRNYGAGEYSDFLSIFPIEEIGERTRHRIEIWKDNSNFFWPQSDSIVTLENARNCLCLAESLDGDAVCYDPSALSFLIFPRHDDVVIATEWSLEDYPSWPLEELKELSKNHRVFRPYHNLKYQDFIFERKSGADEKDLFASSFADRIEAMHAPGNRLRHSVCEAEIIYSKQWCARIQLHQFSTFFGPRLSMCVSYNRESESLIESKLISLLKSELQSVSTG